MHRYVDHDLNEEESDLLFEHLRHCEDCAEKFELLNELSTQLEELPLVVPSFSLVDAILPKLEAIDRTRQEEGTTAEFISPVASVALESDTNHRVQRKETSRRGRFYRVGALGTVAAAAILGLFIYQYEPQTIPNAEITSESLDNSSNAKVDKSDSAKQNSASNGEAADVANMDKNFSQDTATAPGSDKSLADSNNAADGTTNQAPASTESPATGDKMTSPNSRDNSSPSTSTAPTTGANSNTTKPGSSKQSDPSALKGSPAAEDALDPYGLMETSGGDDANGMVSRMGIADSGFAANAALSQWNSPNGSYTVELQDGHLYFYKITSEVERLLVVDQTINGNWVTGEWSGDSATFNYQTEQNGVTSSYTVDPLKESNIQAISP
ncbi:hypothetical protein GCM10008013_29830 [Paenibacillus segetis]|uniref:Zinc-finger n=2 Tax=Paenibacillus segetis TaxID=1325360 RepID=A0ABQ1YL14_9BACL|nr:hypothetical protein GCM10008013_29830 [Paenibacillus segetis]